MQTDLALIDENNNNDNNKKSDNIDYEPDEIIIKSKIIRKKKITKLENTQENKEENINEPAKTDVKNVLSNNVCVQTISNVINEVKQEIVKKRGRPKKIDESSVLSTEEKSQQIGRKKTKEDKVKLEKEKKIKVEKDKVEKDKVEKVKKMTIPKVILEKSLKNDKNVIEIGVDEVGRGPLFGRVYTAAVILPNDESLFDFWKMKDSKKFHSKNKIEEVADYIKQHALAWYVSFEDEKTIDNINILQATQQSMHSSINEVKKQFIKSYNERNCNKNNENCKKTDYPFSFHLLIDGNYFNPILSLNNGKLEQMPYTCIEGGDNKYASIAAASILAKVERDKYIDELCELHPELCEKYGINNNKGYGAKKHLDGIKEHGITIWHRRTFGICKNYV